MANAETSPERTAALIAALLALDPHGLGGVWVRSSPCPARDNWLGLVRNLINAQTPLRKLPTAIDETRLLGGLDLAATLHAGRPIAECGLLSEVDGGLLVASMAERCSTLTAAHLAGALDWGCIHLERDGLGLTSDSRFGVIALDEGIGPDESLNPMIADRLAFRLDLSLLSPSQDFEALFTLDDLELARSKLSSVVISDAMIEALCAAQLSLAIDSARAGLLAVKTAISLAALGGRDQVLDSDAALAAELVLAPRARALPADQSEPETSQDDDPPDQPDDPLDPPPESAEDQQPDLTDLILDAVRAVLPADLLAQLQDQARAPKSGQGGRAGLLRKVKHRGRATGSRPGTLGAGARLNVIDTLRAAAPWQRIRRQNHVSQTARRIFITKSDFRITNFKQRAETATIFVVDASGSSALNRLAEAKGAVELLLADCYARRDVVAVISFRGRAPEILLPPTRSLVRAKRGLAGLPGGGGTPLASAIDAAGELAQAIRRKGQVPAIIFLTDGRANIARDGAQGRAGADADAMIAAKQLRESGLKTLLIDTSPRPQEEGARIAQAMGARYLALPFANAQALSTAARQIIDAPHGATR